MNFHPLLLLLLMTVSLSSQTITPLGDLKPGSENSVFPESNTAIFFNEILYFSADSDDNGVELMKYDGTSTQLVKDIHSGTNSSEPRNFYELNGKLLFTANDGLHGNEWWITDGTEEGTQLLIDIFIGEENGVWNGNSDPYTSFHLYNNELLFVGLDGKNNFELWKTDGSADGTKLVKNIAPDNNSFNQPSFPEGFVDFKGEVYFACREGLWKTDGTTSGTKEVKSDHPTDVFGFSPGSLYATSELIFMLENPGVWVSDGTEEGTVNIATLGQVNVNWSGNRFTQVGDVVLFPGDDGVHGNELWRSDGTPEGTNMVIDLWPGSEGYAPQNTVLLQGKYYYKGDNGSSGIELYTSDGTAEGTKLVKDIKSGGQGSFFLPTTLVANEDLIFMNAGTSFTKIKLWQSDGTASGTRQVSELGDAERPITFYPFDGKLFFFAKTDQNGWEPYVYDPKGMEVDADNDGFTADEDCDDNNAAVNPEAVEIPFNNIDDDCNAATLDNDGDQDGFDIDSDCNDDDPLINPDAEEVLNNDIDENCDGEIGTSSVINLGKVNVSLQPNPASTFVYILSEHRIQLEISAYNTFGQRIAMEEHSTYVDVSQWETGIYFFTIFDRVSKEYHVEKMIIRN